MSDPAPRSQGVHHLEYSKPAPRPRGKWIGVASLSVGVVIVAVFFGAVVSSPRRYPPPNRLVCASNMRQIGEAIAMYANDHNNIFPDSLTTLLANEDLASKVFVCPSSNDTPAPGTTTQAAAQSLTSGGHLSYVYVGKGLTSSMATEDVVLLYEPPSNHSGDGMNVLYGDFHVEFTTGATAASILAQAKSGVLPIRVPAATQPATAPSTHPTN